MSRDALRQVPIRSTVCHYSERAAKISAPALHNLEKLTRRLMATCSTDDASKLDPHKVVGLGFFNIHHLPPPRSTLTRPII